MVGLLLACVVGIVAGFGWWWLHRPHASRSLRRAAPPANAPSAWEQVTADIGPHGEVSKDVALRAFSLVFGPVPGVGPLPPMDSSVPWCGTEPLRWVRAHTNELTPEQRAAVERLSNPPDRSPVEFTAQIRGRDPTAREARSIEPHVRAARERISRETGHRFTDEILVTVVSQSVLDADHAWATATPRCHRRSTPGHPLTPEQEREYAEGVEVLADERIKTCDCHVRLSPELLDLAPS